MATTLGSLVVDLQANTALFLRGMDRAENSVNRLERNIRTQFSRINRTIQGFQFIIGGALVTGLSTMVGNVTKAIETTGRFADRINISVEELTRLQYAAQSTGVPIQILNTALQRQVRRIAEAEAGNTSYQKALGDLEISLEEIIGLSPDQQFLRIAEAMQGLSTQGERVRLAMQFWDTEGVALIQTVNQGTDAIMAMARESDELGNTLTGNTVASAIRFNEAWARLSTSIGNVARDLVTLLAPALSTLADWLRVAIRGLRDFFQWLGLIDQSIDTLSLEAVNKQIEATEEKLESARQAMERLDDTFAGRTGSMARNAAAARVADLEEQLEELESRQIKIEAQSKLTEGAVDSFTGSLDRQKQKTEEITSPTDEYINSLNRQLEALQFVQFQVELLLDWYDRLPPHLQVLIDANKALANELDRLGVAVEEVTEPQINTFAELMIEQLKRVESAFVTFWENVLLGNKNLFDNFRRLAISILAEIIHTYTTKKIVATIETIIRGASGQQGQGQGQQRQGGILGAGVQLLGQLAGGAVGVVLGSVLGSLLGGGSRIKESQLFAGNLLGRQPGSLASNVASPFGTNIAFGFHRIGGEGQLSNAEAERILTTLENASEVMVAIDEMIVGTLDDARIGNIRNILASSTAGSLNYDPANVDQFIRDRFTNIFASIDESNLGAVFREFSAGLQGDELLQYANDVARIHEIFHEGGQIFDDLASAAETVNALMEDFVEQGESIAEVLQRIQATNAVLSQIGLGGATAASSRFNQDVLAAVGGDVSRLGELVDTFFSTFFTDIENLERMIADLSPVISEVLAGLDTTRQGFAGDFLRLIEEGLLSPDDIATWLQAGEAIRSLIDLEEQLAQIRENEANAARQAEIEKLTQLQAILNDNLNTINALIVAEQQLQVQIDSVVEAIRGTFGNTIEELRLSLLDSEGQYGFFVSAAESLAVGLDTLTDPAEIQRRMDEINRRITQALGVLDETQVQTVAPDFIAFLESVLQSGEQRLTQLSEESIGRQEEFEARRDTILQDLADSVSAAAALNNQSSTQFSSAVAAFGQIASTPRQIQISFNQDLVGA